MVYNPLTVTQPDEPRSFAYPSITAELVLITDSLDGEVIGPINASGASVARFDTGRGKMKTIASVSDVKIEVYITEARVMLICKKYDKGGGWVGGGASLVLNAGSKILAANRRRGKALTAHVRYPWVVRILFQPKQGFGGQEALRLVFTSEGTQMYLQLYLDKSTDSAALAHAILERTVAYRRADTDPHEPAEAEAFTALLKAGRVPAPAKGSMAGYAMPTSFPAPSGEKFAPAGPPSKVGSTPPKGSPSAP
jgi:hypothetical protein